VRTLAETRTRIECLCYVLLLFTGLLVARLVIFQVFQHHPSSRSETKREIIVPRRAGIYTRDGVALAVSPQGTEICANPRAVLDKETAAARLAPALHLSYAELLDALNKTEVGGRKNYFVRLQPVADAEMAKSVESITMQLAQEGKAASEQAIYARPFNYREYPRGDFASQLIGFVDCDNKGVQGIEFSWNNMLSGKIGYREAEVDARGNPIPNGRSRFVAPVEGKHVVLTIDDQIQSYAEQAAQAAVDKYHPNWMTAIVMNPRTGEILAMATRPGFDPNNIRPDQLGHREINRAVSDPYEPGSTFKLVTASAALETLPAEKLMTRINCRGTLRVGKHTIRCWIFGKEGRGHGPQTLAEGIKNSCNIAMIGYARMIGKERLYRYAQLFGVGETTNVGCAREKTGVLPPLESWDQARLANIAFGQGLTLTPIQLLRIVATIANGGVMMQPFIVKEIRSIEGKTVTSFHPKVLRRVISEEAARRLTAMMEKVVTEGTGKLAAVKGYRVAGKTGSAQKVVKGRYRAFVSSFVGFLPAEDPKIAIVVVADEPHESHWGSVVCGPVFAEIASKSMMRLQLERTLLAEHASSASLR
jgi:cell division protein FtsI/penicillin-binding protein 2